MNILVTGANGFIGQALVKRLICSRSAQAPSRLILVSRRFAAPPTDSRVHMITGDIADSDVLQRALDDGVDVVFHLAVVPGGLSESQFELGKRVNLDATIGLLDLLRRQSKPARFVFASSIGVYGEAMRAAIDESTVPAPTLSYGAQKLIGEILVADYSRRGFIDGHSVRVPFVVARPPQASDILSGFMSDLILDLSAGRAFTCPVAPESMAWWMSITCVVDNLLHAAALPVQHGRGQRVWQLPVLHASMAEVVAGIARIHGAQVLRKISYRNDPDLRAQFADFPLLHCPRSIAAGFRHDATIENLVHRALEGTAVE